MILKLWMRYINKQLFGGRRQVMKDLAQIEDDVEFSRPPPYNSIFKNRYICKTCGGEYWA